MGEILLGPPDFGWDHGHCHWAVAASLGSEYEASGQSLLEWIDCESFIFPFVLHV